MKTLEHALLRQGFSLKPVSSAEPDTDVRVYTLDVRELLPKRAVSAEGALALDVTLYFRDDDFGIRLEGPHRAGNVFKVDIKRVAFDGIKKTVDASLGDLIVSVVGIWLKSSPVESDETQQTDAEAIEQTTRMRP